MSRQRIHLVTDIIGCTSPSIDYAAPERAARARIYARYAQSEQPIPYIEPIVKLASKPEKSGTKRAISEKSAYPS